MRTRGTLLAAALLAAAAPMPASADTIMRSVAPYADAQESETERQGRVFVVGDGTSFASSAADRLGSVELEALVRSTATGNLSGLSDGGFAEATATIVGDRFAWTGSAVRVVADVSYAITSSRSSVAELFAWSGPEPAMFAAADLLGTDLVVFSIEDLELAGVEGATVTVGSDRYRDAIGEASISRTYLGPCEGASALLDPVARFAASAGDRFGSNTRVGFEEREELRAEVSEIRVEPAEGLGCFETILVDETGFEPSNVTLPRNSAVAFRFVGLYGPCIEFEDDHQSICGDFDRIFTEPGTYRFGVSGEPMTGEVIVS